MEHVQYHGFQKGWTCADGSPAVVAQGGGIWASVTALIAALRAEGAIVTWMERGMHGVRDHAIRSIAAQEVIGVREREARFGMLGGLEDGQLEL